RVGDRDAGDVRADALLRRLDLHPGNRVSTISRLHGQWCETLFGTLPSTNRLTPAMPRLPTTTRSALTRSATSTSASAGPPGRACASTFVPPAVAACSAARSHITLLWFSMLWLTSLRSNVGAPTAAALPS